MANEKPVTHDEFLGLCAFIMRFARDAMVEALTLRSLLEHHGVFSQAEFDAMRERVQAKWNQDLSETTTRMAVDANAASVRKFLEEFQGPKH